MPIVSHATEADLELFRRELDSFVPEVICDAHMHLWAKIAPAPDRLRRVPGVGGRRHRSGRVPPPDGRAAARPARRRRPDPARRGRRARRADRGPERLHRGRGGRQPRLARRHAGLAGYGPRVRTRGGAPPGAGGVEVLPRAQRAAHHLGRRHPGLSARGAGQGRARRAPLHHPAHGQGASSRRPVEPALDPPLLRDLSGHAAHPGPRGARFQPIPHHRRAGRCCAGCPISGATCPP